MDCEREIDGGGVRRMCGCGSTTAYAEATDGAACILHASGLQLVIT